MLPRRAYSPVVHEGSEQHHQPHNLERDPRNTWVATVSVLAEALEYDDIRDADSYIEVFWPGWLGRAHGSELVALNDNNTEENMDW